MTNEMPAFIDLLGDGTLIVLGEGDQVSVDFQREMEMRIAARLFDSHGRVVCEIVDPHGNWTEHEEAHRDQIRAYAKARNRQAPASERELAPASIIFNPGRDSSSYEAVG